MDFIKKYGENSDINIRHYNNKNSGELYYYLLDLTTKKKMIKNIKKVIYWKF